MTTKERTEKINEHIMEFFDTKKELIETINANIFGERAMKLYRVDVYLSIMTQ